MKSSHHHYYDPFVFNSKKLRKSHYEDDVADSVKEKFKDKHDRKEKKTSRVVHVSHGFDLVKGKMDHAMEDRIVAETREIDGHELGLYAIFDGHSGRAVADYLQDNLFDNILDQPDFWKNTETAVKRAYQETDEVILNEVVGSRGGSTAVTAILIDKKKLVVANVGDSRAILCNREIAKQVSVDHEPRKEQDVIEEKGGFVSQSRGNVPRVDGQLAMTRAFGDGKLKKHITSEPDVTVKKINKETKFLILGSDGLWKVMSNQEALDCIKDIENAQDAAEELVKEAIDRKSYDDISCIVVSFDHS